MADVTPTPSPLGLLGLLGASLAWGIVARKGELGNLFRSMAMGDDG